MRNTISNNNYSNNGDVNQNIDNSRTKTIIKGNHIQIFLVVVVVIILLVLIGAFIFQKFNTLDKKIIGKWRNEDNTEIYIEFKDEGNMLMIDNTGTLHGTYFIKEDDSINITFKVSIFEYMITADASIHGKILKFENINNIFGAENLLGLGNTTSFKKVN